MWGVKGLLKDSEESSGVKTRSKYWESVGLTAFQMMLKVFQNVVSVQASSDNFWISALGLDQVLVGSTYLSFELPVCKCAVNRVPLQWRIIALVHEWWHLCR
jgi:hypothetical protein